MEIQFALRKRNRRSLFKKVTENEPLVSFPDIESLDSSIYFDGTMVGGFNGKAYGIEKILIITKDGGYTIDHPHGQSSGLSPETIGRDFRENVVKTIRYFVSNLF